MMVYVRNVGDSQKRIGLHVTEELPAGWMAAGGEDCLVVVHPNHGVNDWLTRNADAWLNVPRCRALLIVSGLGNYCGLGAARAKQWMMRYPGRLRILSYARSDTTEMPEAIRDRWSNFWQHVTQKNEIHWDILDPSYPENLLAVYFALLACCKGTTPLDWPTVYKAIPPQILRDAAAEWTTRKEALPFEVREQGFDLSSWTEQIREAIAKWRTSNN